MKLKRFRIKRVKIKKFLQKIKRTRKSRLFFFFIIPVLFVAASTYTLLLVFYPAVNYYISGDKASNEVNKEELKKMENSIVIPRIKASVQIFEGDQEDALSKGAWHRKPEQGNPLIGGNFIVTGHRFNFALTPSKVKNSSPFYNIDKLQNGDTIFIVWEGEVYEYEVSKIYTVKPNQVEIEDQSEEHKLTLYTCTLGGHLDGRTVIEAHPLFTPVNNEDATTSN